jgi:hypothetical protein
MVPSSLALHFFDRESELDQLAKKFGSHGGVAVLVGLGGIGKTQVALAYAHNHKYEYDVVLWVTCHSESAILQTFSDAAKTLGLVANSEQNQCEGYEALLHWMQNSRK